MLIFQDNLDDRLGEICPLPEITAELDEYLLIAHPERVERSIEIALPRWLADEKCKGILYVKGGPYGGLGTRSAAAEVESRHRGRVHFLSYAVERAKDVGARQQLRFRLFFDEVRERGRVDWNIIDPRQPEYLTAVYFLAKAVALLKGTPEAQRILDARSSWETIEETGKEEFRSFLGRDFPYERIDVETAESIAGMIGYHLSPPSESVGLCATLKHDWLENQFLRGLRRLRNDAAAGSDESSPALLIEVPEWLEEARRLVTLVRDGFDAVQLVDAGPLCQLPDDIRKWIRDDVFKTYFSSGRPEALVTEVETAIDQLESATKACKDQWLGSEPQSRLTMIDLVLESAELLKKALGALPRGVSVV